MTITDYNKQAEQFLVTAGVTFKAEYLGPDCPLFCSRVEQLPHMLPCGGIHGGKYRITFSRPGRSLSFDVWNSYHNEYGPGDAAWLKFNNLQPFHWNRLISEAWLKDTSLADRRCKTTSALGVSRNRVIAVPPTAYEVLAGMSTDADCPDTFEDWCSEYGYSVDSRRAETTYRLCKDYAFKLVKFWTSQELEILRDIY